jgi:hypothetical protein
MYWDESSKAWVVISKDPETTLLMPVADDGGCDDWALATNQEET